MNATGGGGDRPTSSESFVVMVDPRQNGQAVTVRGIRHRATVFLKRFVALGC